MEKLNIIFNPYDLKWGEEIEFSSTRNYYEYGNRIYNRYPARSIFLVPRSILLCQNKNGLNVLDPFMGSGTTAVETRITNNISFGLEMDPFARKVAEVSSTIYTLDEIQQIEHISETIKNDYSNYSCCDIPNLTGITRWFKEGDLQKILKL